MDAIHYLISTSNAIIYLLVTLVALCNGQAAKWDVVQVAARAGLECRETESSCCFSISQRSHVLNILLPISLSSLRCFFLGGADADFPGYTRRRLVSRLCGDGHLSFVIVVVHCFGDSTVYLCRTHCMIRLSHVCLGDRRALGDLW